MTPVSRLLIMLAAVAGLMLAATGHAVAQASAPTPPASKPEMIASCPGLISSGPRRVIPAAVRQAALASDQVRLTYVGHSTFLIESPQLVRIATDYNDYVRPLIVPDIVTMNKAHSTHYSLSPDPGIKLVLRGWSDDGKPAAHDQTLRDVRVRSVATNIRTWDGDGTERHGNSIFIFEAAALC
ncbi:MAG: MBL fold metallo-hydrolase, partial [Rhodoplanes sp.]